MPPETRSQFDPPRSPPAGPEPRSGTETSTAPEYCALVQESAYGVPVASPVLNTSLIYVRMPESNSFAPVMDGVQQDIPFGGGSDVVADTVQDNFTVTGSLKTLLYPTQAAFLLGWSLTRVNALGTTPWATTEPQWDQASVSAYHAIRRRDGSWKYLWYPGGKVTTGKISVSRGNPKVTLELGLQFMREVGNPILPESDLTAATFPVIPNDLAYPLGPYLHSHSAGLVSFAGAPLVSYESLDISWTNKLDPRWFEGHFLQILGAKGREFTADIALLLKASPDLRNLYISLATEPMSIGFSNTTHSATISLGGKNHITKVPYNLELGKEFLQPLSIKNRWDPTVSTDIAVTFT